MSVDRMHSVVARKPVEDCNLLLDLHYIYCKDLDHPVLEVLECYLHSAVELKNHLNKGNTLVLLLEDSLQKQKKKKKWIYLLKLNHSRTSTIY